MTRKQIEDILLKGTATVTFTKKSDNTERIMICTLREDLIPNNQRPKNSVPSTGNVIKVYNTELSEWRSFDILTIKNISPN